MINDQDQLSATLLATALSVLLLIGGELDNTSPQICPMQDQEQEIEEDFDYDLMKQQNKGATISLIRLPLEYEAQIETEKNGEIKMCYSSKLHKPG
jgi:hypothetical protein